MSARSVTETRMINKHGSVEIPACLSQFNTPHLGVQISAVKACKHTGDTRTRVNTPEGSNKTTVVGWVAVPTALSSSV